MTVKAHRDRKEGKKKKGSMLKEERKKGKGERVNSNLTCLLLDCLEKRKKEKGIGEEVRSLLVVQGIREKRKKKGKEIWGKGKEGKGRFLLDLNNLCYSHLTATIREKKEKGGESREKEERDRL